MPRIFSPWQVGPGVKGLNEGNWVIPLKRHMGTWQDLAVMKAADLLAIPQDCMPPEYAALSQQLCLAYCLLEQFGKLKVQQGLKAVPWLVKANVIANKMACASSSILLLSFHQLRSAACHWFVLCRPVFG